MKQAFSSLFTVIGTVLFALLILPDPALAEESPNAIHVGRLISIQNDVLLEQEGQTVTPAINDKLYANQTIITEEASRAVIKFRDGSQFIIGPNSIIEIETLLFNPAEKQASNAISVLQGSFQYSSGFTVKSQKFALKTPTALLAVRGSAFQGVVEADMPVFLSLSKGSASVINGAGDMDLTEGESVILQDEETLPPDPDKIPAAISLQGLDYIQKEVGDPFSETPLTSQQIKEDALANRTPLEKQMVSRFTSQEERNTLATLLPLKTLLADAGRWWSNRDILISSALAAAKDALTLMVEANNLNLFDRSVPQTPAMQQLIDRVERSFPDAAAQVQEINNQQQDKNRENQQSSTKEVINWAANVSESNQELAQIVESAVDANTDIAQSAVEGALSVEGKTNNTTTAIIVTAAITETKPELAASTASTAVRMMPTTDKGASAAAIAASLSKIAGPESAAAIIASVINEAGQESAGLITGSVLSILGTQGTANLKQAVADALGMNLGEIDTAVNAAKDEIEKAVKKATDTVNAINKDKKAKKEKKTTDPTEKETVLTCRQSTTGALLDCSGSTKPTGFDPALYVTYSSTTLTATQIVALAKSMATSYPSSIAAITTAAITASTSSAALITTAVIEASPSSAAAITTAAIAASPSSAAAITTAAVTAYPASAAAITTAAIAAYPSSAAAITTAAVTANTGSAAAITTAAVTAYPSLAADLTTAAVTAYPSSAAAITTAAVAAYPTSAAAIVTAAVTANTGSAANITTAAVNASPSSAVGITTAAITAYPSSAAAIAAAAAEANLDLASDILIAAIAANPSLETEITAAVKAVAPDATTGTDASPS
ncbi:MAG: FecR domain-containing protein [Magnetococcales bacterium]|nr:FecR domain-containing protein [Magnetococcales bacterium]